MLRTLRENTKTILWIVIIAFVISIFAIWGMNLKSPQSRYKDKGIVGYVDKEPISSQTYSNVINQLYAQLRKEKGEDYNPSKAEDKILREQAWEFLVKKILITKEIQKLNIKVSDDELVTFLKTNPHPSLKKVFKDKNGNFDYQAYLKALADPNMDWTELENWGRSVLPETKLQLYLAGQIHITEKDILDKFRENNLEMKAEYVRVPFTEEKPPYQPGEDEIAKKYNEIKDEFKDPEMRKINIIKIDKKPSPADESDARERAIELRDEILKGKDFAEAAKEASDDDITAPKGGDLGFIKKGDMVKEFEDVAFSLKAGEVSEPVRTNYGYHLIKVDEKKFENGVEKLHVRHILIKVEPGYETMDSLTTLVQDLSEAIVKKGFEKAAEEYKLKVLTPPPFPQGSFIKDLGYVPQVISFAFNHPVDKISAGIDTDAAIYFVKVVDKIPAGVKPLEEVKDIVIAKIREQRKIERALKVAKEIRKEVLAGESLEKAAHKAELEAKETPYFKLHDTIPNIGTNTAFAEACFLLPPSKVSPPIKGVSGYFIIIVKDKKQPNMDDYAKQKKEIMLKLQDERSSRFIADWYDQIRKNSKVVDLRERTLN
ncbi:hypothetical protein DRQ05_05505 [bacterium]|nr:MAG: hypothetical protein DRQ05_05505 [bacterium]